jgi:Zn-dependent metalloprotease
MKPNAGFHSFAGLTAKSAASLYGHDSAERKAVVDAWNQVGIKIS